MMTPGFVVLRVLTSLTLVVFAGCMAPWFEPGPAMGPWPGGPRTPMAAAAPLRTAPPEPCRNEGPGPASIGTHNIFERHQLRTSETLERDAELIQAAMLLAASVERCPNVRLILRPALPGRGQLWENHNRLWDHVYHLSVCGRPHVYRWTGFADGRHHFRQETGLWRDGYIPRVAGDGDGPVYPPLQMPGPARERWEQHRRHVAEENERAFLERRQAAITAGGSP
ncbi:MAG: hypothetical protein IT371_23690 [Deltaproteobacteria bacterium]|nr:hypothetical protein [Deltaproteobacteria bacterium]